MSDALDMRTDFTHELLRCRKTNNAWAFTNIPGRKRIALVRIVDETWKPVAYFADDDDANAFMDFILDFGKQGYVRKKAQP